LVEASKTLFLHSYIPESNAAEQSICGISCFLTIFGKALIPTKLRIKLQERTLRCQLKFCSKGFKRSRYGSLHAYLPIDLAVETSQPHFFNKKANLQKFIDDVVLILMAFVFNPKNKNDYQYCLGLNL